MDFAFTGILDQNATQDELFDIVAKPVVLKFFISYKTPLKSK